MSRDDIIAVIGASSPSGAAGAGAGSALFNTRFIQDLCQIRSLPTKPALAKPKIVDIVIDLRSLEINK
jgi:hypothetical protein